MKEGDKVKTEEGHEGYIVQMMMTDSREVAKVQHPEGLENWYLVSGLTKLPYKEKYRRKKS